MKNRELDKLVEAIADQPGVRVRRTKAGWYFSLPDGSGTSLHRTPSDAHSMRNFRATITRAGVEWPGRKRAIS